MLPRVDTCDSASLRGSHLTVSKVSSNSVSKASTRLTVKVKEAKIEEAIAKLRLQQLKKKFELQQRRETVMHEEELLEVRSTIEQARLRVQILEEEDQSEECFDRSYWPPRATSVPEIKRYDQRTGVYSNVESGLTPEMKRNMPSRPSRDDTYASADLDPATSRHVDKHADLDPATSHRVDTHSGLEPAMSHHFHIRSDFDLEPRMVSDTPSGHRDYHCVTPRLKREPTHNELGTDVDAGYSPYQGNLERLLHQQQQMIGLQQQTFQSMASTIKQGFSLPKPDISKFDGNPLDNWNFVCSFDNGIAKNASDDSERLSYLLQYCTGATRDAIKSCLALDSAVGYQTARTLLEERFGHPYKITAAHLNRITRGAPLKPYDQCGLLTFADQLRDCQNVLESIGYMDEINSADNLRNVIERLPFHLKVKWLEVADCFRENGPRKRIHHISEFVSKRARAVNDPVFGNVVTTEASSRS